MSRSSVRAVTDPVSGRKIVFAPVRSKRPGIEAQETPLSESEQETCPFCEGNEKSTPSELFALPVKPARKPNEIGWGVRVVPNLFPAFEHHYVIIHSPSHISSFADIGAAQILLIAEAWAEVADRAWKEGFDYPFFFINEGRRAGSSREHSHSQAVWFKETPPELELETPHLAHGNCTLCSLLDSLPPQYRLLESKTESLTIMLAVSPFGRTPYELLIAPKEHSSDVLYSTAVLASALKLASEGIGRIRRLEGRSLPFNLWLHSFQSDGHWHFELLPRLTIPAGLELGTGVFINTLEPDEAARRLGKVKNS